MMAARLHVAADGLPPVDRYAAVELGEAEGRAVLAVLRALGDDDWQRPTDCVDWDVRTLVSHLVGQCEDAISLPTLMRRELAGRRRRLGSSASVAHMAVQVAEHADESGPELVELFATYWPRAVRARSRRPTPLRRLPIDLGVPGVARASLGYLFDVIYDRDLWMHRIDLTRATGQPFTVGTHDGQLVAQVIRDLARQWSGPAVALELSGPAGGAWTFGPDRPTAVVRAGAVDYLRTLAGRDHDVELTLISGDESALSTLRRARIVF